jgi:YbbR domain-containing protein
MLTVVIGEARKERVLEKVPVAYLNLPQGLQPPSRFVRVTLLGPPSVLDSIQPSDVEVVADGATAKAPANEVKLELRLHDVSDKVTGKQVEPSVIRLK